MSASRRLFRIVLLGVLLAFIVGVTPAYAAPVVADSWPGGVEFWWGFHSSYDGLGQSFTAIDGTLDSVQFRLTKWGNPTGTLRAFVYSHSGLFGNASVPGTLLATSAPVDISTLTAVIPADQLVTFAFDNTVALDAGTNYVVTVERSGFADADNGLAAVSTNDVPGHPGNGCTRQTGIGWMQNTSYDMVFSVFETPPAVVSTPAASPWSLAIVAALGLGAVVVIRRVRVTV